MTERKDYSINSLRPYINWLYFYHAWGLSGKPQAEKDKMRKEADLMLDVLDSRYMTHAVFGVFDANSDGDDIIVGTVRMPMLRQQYVADGEGPYLSLADFVRPLSSGVKDKVGAFATTVDTEMEHDYLKDDFKRMLVQTDRKSVV